MPFFSEKTNVWFLLNVKSLLTVCLFRKSIFFWLHVVWIHELFFSLSFHLESVLVIVLSAPFYSEPGSGESVPLV